jgi:hypothetical protein
MHGRFPVLTTDFSAIDLKAMGSCCFRKWNCPGFSPASCALISAQFPNSTAPSLRDFDVRRATGGGYGNSVTWLCGFLEGSCGRDGWGRSTYAICCEAAHSPHRCFHSSSKSCWIRRDRGNSAPTSSALESVAHVEPYLSSAKAYPDQQTPDRLGTPEHS